MASLDPTVNSTVKAAFRFFTHSQATLIFDPPSIIIGPIEDKHTLDEAHFYDLQ